MLSSECPIQPLKAGKPPKWHHVRLLLETENWYTNTIIQTSFPQIENSWP